MSNREFYYHITNWEDELRDILNQLKDSGSANLGPVVTWTHYLFHRPSHYYKTGFTTVPLYGRISLITEEGLKCDMTMFPNFSLDVSYEYDSLIWTPNNQERKQFVTACDAILPMGDEQSWAAILHNHFNSS
jgi:hypothetical protein